MSNDRAGLINPLWLLFAERVGHEGAAWTAAFQKYAPVMRVGNRGLKFMRLRQVEEGYNLLQQAKDMMDSHEEIPASMLSVLNRYYYGILAYYSYCIEDFDLASHQLTLAEEWVVRAVSEAKCLLLLSFDCQEFCLHQARIAYKQGRWDEMHGWFGRARAMALNEEPLCKTRNGESIFFSSFDGFLDSLRPLTAEEEDLALDFTDLGRRIQFFDNFTQRFMSKLEQAQLR